MQFHVRTLSADNLLTSLTVEASDEADARRQVEVRGLFAAEVRPVRTTLFGGRKTGGAGASRFSLVLFSQELLALLNAGLSLVEGLEALLEKEASAHARTILARLLAGLREGRRFSAVLSDQPGLFPPLYIGVVRAAEGTSDLPRAMERFIDHQQRIDGIRSRIISAAIYPLILLLVGGAVTVFLIGYVVPRFAEVYQGAGRDLPWLSQLLLQWGQFASDHTRGVTVAAVLAVIVAAAMVRRLYLHGGLARLLAILPGVGERVHVYELSRLYLTLGMLLEGGIPIVAAMQSVHGMVSPAIRSGLLVSRQAIEAGTPLSTAFQQNGLATPVSLRMLRVGERSGKLGQMLTQSANFYDGEIGRWIERFTRTFEPALMAAIGLVVGTIVVLLYMPIFDLAGSFS